MACSAPRNPYSGGDVAGEVVKVGQEVKDLKVGDRVFGRADHNALGEYALLEEPKSAIIPESLTYQEAAALPLVSITAFDALSKAKAQLKGSRVLINGASGGIGTMAVQMAKARGATVHGICSQKNESLVQQLGADQAINYQAPGFLESLEPYDLIIDLVGNLDQARATSLLKEKGVFVMVGFSGFRPMLSFLLRSLFIRSKSLVTIDAKTTTAKLNEIAQKVVANEIKPVIDQVYDFEQTQEAFEHLGSRRAKGKIVIRVEKVKW